MAGFKGSITVVLVHGAWADGSSWNDIIGPLLSKGLNVLAAPSPLTSLSDDAAALDRAIEHTHGPVVLVARAYAGAVIAANTSERVQSLVFIAALAPDEGETVAEVFYRGKPHPQAPQLAPDVHGNDLDTTGGICNRFLSACIPRMPALFVATRCRMHSRESSKARLESKAVSVPPRRRRPDDQPSHPALYGATHGRVHPVGEGRPYAIG
jgi:pimeloyl-ACP methyl ester carboxylesterase